MRDDAWPVPLVRKERFDDRGWLFELKHDGVRSLAKFDGHRCRLVNWHRRA